MTMSFYHVVIAVLMLSLAGCMSLPDARQRTHDAENLAGQNGWARFDIAASPFVIAGFGSERSVIRKEADVLHVYIEGDGLALLDRQTPSLNPTPLHPVALQLAMADPMPSAYLARPCQYVMNAACDDNRWWLGSRIAPDVVRAMGVALDALKLKYGAKQVTLIGYSGGGAIAAILAATRTDVVQLITVASNLDIKTWVDYHRTIPLDNSLNPADYAAALANIPQTHFVGGNDKIVPPEIAASFATKFPTDQKPRIITIADYTHKCCWVEKWPVLIKQVIQ